MFLSILLLNSLAFAQPPIKVLQLFSIGVKVFPSGNEVKLYVETSFWTPYFLGADTGIEISGKNIELYGEAQAGAGILGYSHGFYYRFPYGLNSYVGMRGKLWMGLGYYVTRDYDYTMDRKGFGMFASFPAVLAMQDIGNFCQDRDVYCWR